jgi:hypothetical protein
MITQTWKIEGLKEVMDALKELPYNVQAKVFQGIASKAGRKYIVNELKTLLPYSSKTKAQIKVVTDIKDKTAIYAGISPKTFWIRFVEYGTKPRQTKKGRNRGTIAGVARVLPIVDKQIYPIIEFYNKDLGIEVEKSLKRRIKRVNKINSI